MFIAYDLPPPPTQSTTSAKALFSRAQQHNNDSLAGPSSCRRLARRNRSLPGAASSRTPGLRLATARSLAEPYAEATATRDNQDSYNSASTSASTDSTHSAPTRLDILLGLVQANSESRIHRRAERQRKAEMAHKANEKLRQQMAAQQRAQKQLVLGKTRSETWAGADASDVDSDGLDDRALHQMRNQSCDNGPKGPSPRKLLLQQTRSLPAVFEHSTGTGPPHVNSRTRFTSPMSVKSPEKRPSQQQTWGGGVKPCGLRGSTSRGRSVGATLSGGDVKTVMQPVRSSQEGAVNLGSAGGLRNPFKAPRMIAKPKTSQDQNNPLHQPKQYDDKFYHPMIKPSDHPHRPPPKPLSDKTGDMNSLDTSRSTSSSTMASTIVDPLDTGNDSFDDDMEGLLMGGGEDVEALLRICDGG
jgi:hypothetical protein